MRVSINWLREFVEFDQTPEQLADTLTMLGLEIESIESMAKDISGIKVGEILSIEPHPDADRLVVCKVDVGAEEPLQIVCGATNMKVGDRVPTATIGGSLPGFKIGKRKMRGVQSQGMMCSAKELGLGDDHGGLLILDKASEIGSDVVELLGLDDTVLDIEITPNRGDWAGMIGIARELAAHIRVPLTLPDDGLTESGESAASQSSVTIEDPDLCLRYAGRIIRNITLGPSPIWLTQRLVAAGQRPINNIVDITNYILMETGQPLHGFDYDKLAENRIVVRRAKDGETIKTLDGENRKLTGDMLVIADAQVPAAIAGIMGGAESEVGEGSKNVFLESAYFLPASIRKTSRALNLISEASTRFQRGADPDMVIFAANRASKLIAELAGGEIQQDILDEYPNPTPLRKVQLRFDRTNSMLGTDIDPKNQREILTELGFEKSDPSHDSATFTVPSRRHDVAHEADLIEEVARLHGFNNIPVTLPRVHPRQEVIAPEAATARNLRAHLVSLGLTELSNLTFTSDAAIQQAKLQYSESRLVRLQNPLSERHAIMRPSLIPGMLEVVSRNDRHGSDQLRIFEMGPTFTADPASDLATETEHIVIALMGSRENDAWHRDSQPIDLYDIKGITEAILEYTGTSTEFRHTEIAPFAPGQCAEIETADDVIGYIGLIHPDIAKTFEISKPVYLLDLNISSLLTQARLPKTFTPVPKFPPALIDLAFVIDSATPAETIRKAAKKAGGKRLRFAEIFDIYTGDQVPAGKKSIALKLTFQVPDRTLTDKETGKDCRKIQEALAHEFGATIR